MEKHGSIVALIDRLRAIFDFSIVRIQDHWDGDLYATGIAKGDRLVYISTFAYLDEAQPLYDFELEILNYAEPDKYQVVKTGEAIAEPELVEELRSFLT